MKKEVIKDVISEGIESKFIVQNCGKSKINILSFDSPLTNNISKINILNNNNNILDNTNNTLLMFGEVINQNYLYSYQEVEKQKKQILEKFYHLNVEWEFIQHIISTIYLNGVTNKMKQKDSYQEMNAEIMRDLYSVQGKWNYKQIINKLIEIKLIECDEQYSIGHKSKGYKINPEFKLGKTKKIKIENELLNNRITNFKLKKLTQMEEKYKKVINSLYTLTIDYNKAIKFIRNKYEIFSEEYKNRLIIINLINDKMFFHTVDNFGKRLHHNLTNLPSDLRKFITLNGKALGQVDIVNSQPLFFLTTLIKNNPNEGEVSKLKDIVSNGEFYEFIMEKVGENNRDIAKKNIFKDILFGKHFIDTKYTQAFKNEFPSIWNYLLEIKKKDYKSIAQNMQEEESKFIFHCINKINRTNDISTIHDSIVVEVEHINYIRLVMEDEFYDRFGFYPQLKVNLFM